MGILVTDDIEYAKQVGDEVFKATKEAEKKMKDAQDEEERKKAEEEQKASGSSEHQMKMLMKRTLMIQKNQRKRRLTTSYRCKQRCCNIIYYRVCDRRFPPV